MKKIILIILIFVSQPLFANRIEILRIQGSVEILIGDEFKQLEINQPVHEQTFLRINPNSYIIIRQFDNEYKIIHDMGMIMDLLHRLRININ